MSGSRPTRSSAISGSVDSMPQSASRTTGDRSRRRPPPHRPPSGGRFAGDRLERPWVVPTRSRVGGGEGAFGSHFCVRGDRLPRRRVTAGRPFWSTHWGVPDPGPRYRRRDEKRILALPPRRSRCRRVCAYVGGRQAPESAGQLGRRPAYPVCTHWALARGGCAPFEPPACRPAVAAGGRGTPSPEPPGRCAHG